MTKELKKAHKIFPSEKDCVSFLETALWGGKPICPYCNGSSFSELKHESRYHCNVCNNSFSVTVKTIFKRTRCDLRKWFVAIRIYMKSPKPPTARDLAAAIDVTKDTAWLMLNKIKKEAVENSDLMKKIAKSVE
jgi:transposase-like protein